MDNVQNWDSYINILHKPKHLIKKCFTHSSRYRSLQVQIIGFLCWITDYKQDATSGIHIAGSLMIPALELPCCFSGSWNYDRITSVICLLANGYVLQPWTVRLWSRMRGGKSDILLCTHKFVSMGFNCRYAFSGYHSNGPSIINVQCSPVNCFPVWRRVRIPPPQSLRVVTGDKREHSLRWDGNVWLLVLSDRVGCVAET
jgi:hypothetical protein